MITSSNSTIPDFIKKSDLYPNACDKNTITYPSKFSPFTITTNNKIIINKLDDLINVLHVMRYWMVNETPHEIYKFIRENSNIITQEDIDKLHNQFAGMKCLGEITLLMKYKNNVYKVERQKTEYKKYMRTYNSDYHKNIKLVDIAAEKGYLNLIKYLYECEKYNGWDFNTYNFAAEYGHIDVLQYLFSNGCNINCPFPYASKSTTCELAASSGYLDCLIFLHENGFEWDYMVIVAAVKNNHFDCVRYACENGCKFTNRRIFDASSFCTLYSAAAATQNDNVEMLKYLIEHDCPWNENNLSFAIQYKSIKCLKYLVSIGGIINRSPGMSQFMGFDLEILKYLNDNNFNFEWSSDVYGHAAKTSFKCFKYAYEQICTLPHGQRCSSSCDHNKINIEQIYSSALTNKACFDYLFEKGYRFSQDNYGSCIYSGLYDTIKYMYDVDIKENGASELSKLVIRDSNDDYFRVYNLPNENGIHMRISHGWTCTYKYNKELKKCYDFALKAGCKIT